MTSHLTRRAMLKGTLVTGSGLIVPNWGALSQARAALEDVKQSKKRCIFLFANGGASQIDTFDMKPGRPTGGPFRPIQSKVTGMQMCEYLPKMAQVADKLAVIRSMKTASPDHPDGIYHMHTCYKQSERTPHPEIGAVIAKFNGDPNSDLPSFVRMGPCGNAGAGYLGPKHEPFSVDRNGRLPYFTSPYANPEAEARRAELFRKMETEFTSGHAAEPFDSHRTAKERAWKLLRAKGAFDLSKEPEKLKAMYGDNEFAKGCLMARRLVEAGIPFVEVGQDNYDSHADNFVCHKANMQILDVAWSALLTDLADRGLLDSTLVIWMGEVGRTPQINNRAGRDHYINAWTVVLAGGGIKGGQVYGSTDIDGKNVKDGLVSEGDLFATIYHALGINHRAKHFWGVRPVWLTPEGSKPVKELV
ncbi:MAG: DUF1501 domain-containing protein [Gemmataceae bacterium]